MLKVNLISFYNRFDEYPTKYSLGTLRIASYIGKNEEIDVKIFAIDTNDVDIDKEVANIIENDPDVIGIPNYMWTEKVARQVSEEITKRNPKILKVVGGPSTNHIDFNKWQSDEIFTLGEGEGIWNSICKKKIENPDFNSNNIQELEEDNVFSLIEDNNKRSVVYTNEKIPMGIPLYSDRMEKMKVDKDPEKFAWFETTRGCLYSCGYCGHKTRNNLGKVELEHIKEEIINMKERGIDQIFIVDPNVGGTRENGKEVLKMFNELLPEVSIIAYLRPELLDDEYIDILSKCNIEEVRFGIQTLNPEVPSWIRSNSIGKIKEELSKLSENNVKWRAELITGLPGDNLEGVMDTTKFVIDTLKPTTVFSYHLTAIPGTRLYDLVDATDDKWIKVDESQKATQSYSYTKEEFKKMAQYATGVTSLYNKLKQNNPKDDIQYDSLLKFIRKHVDEEALKKFETFDLSYSDKFWQEKLDKERNNEVSCSNQTRTSLGKREERLL